jgi:predicted histidine transporter YuiF (NhaC family)
MKLYTPNFESKTQNVWPPFRLLYIVPVQFYLFKDLNETVFSSRKFGAFWLSLWLLYTILVLCWTFGKLYSSKMLQKEFNFASSVQLNLLHWLICIMLISSIQLIVLLSTWHIIYIKVVRNNYILRCPLHVPDVCHKNHSHCHCFTGSTYI